jgi:hypothetical protein
MYNANISSPESVSVEDILGLIQKLLVRGVGCFDEREENRIAVGVGL